MFFADITSEVELEVDCNVSVSVVNVLNDVSLAEDNVLELVVADTLLRLDVES